MKYLKLILVGFLCLWAIPNYAQEKYSLKGIVLEKGTENPVGNIAIFIPYSAIGTTTSADGSFELHNIPEGKYEIHFRHLAYEVYLLDYQTDNIEMPSVKIHLNPMIIEIEEVSLIADPSKRNAYLKMFNEYCLGDITGLACYLLNPDDLFFFVSNDILHARSDEPLIVLNKRFGFKITLYLDDFQFLNPFADYTDSLDQFYSFTGSPLYKKLEGSNFIQELNWEKNREAAFEGSQRHFFISVLNNRLSKNKYSVRAINHSRELACQSIGLTIDESLDPSLVIDSIMDWSSTDNRPKYYYYFPLLDYPDLIYQEEINRYSEFFIEDSILIFHDKYKTASMKDDQAFLLYVESGRVEIDQKGLIDQGEGDLLWKFLGNRRTMRSILPMEYLPEKYIKKAKRRKK